MLTDRPSQSTLGFPIRILFLWLFLQFLPVPAVNGQKADTVYSIGFLEGGDYISHGLFRNVYRRYLEQVMPDGAEFRFEPTGFKSGEWDRKKCTLRAIELSESRRLDMVVAIGPWAVEELRAAGFKRPILAVLQFDPVSQGLISPDGRPIDDNLSIITGRFDLAADLGALMHLTKIRRLGIIVFPSNDGELAAVTTRFEETASQLGISVVPAEGYNNKGTFAFFKALQSLNNTIDAVYVSPLWGMDPELIRQFMQMATDRRIPVISADGRHVIERGALFHSGSLSIEQSARIAAEHTVRIMRGKPPAGLPVFFSMTGSSVVNLDAAAALGATVPDDMLYGSDVVAKKPDPDIDLLSLPDAVTHALSRNQGLQAIDEAIEAAAAAASIAGSALWPQLTADGSVGFIDDNAVANSAGRFDNFRFRGTVSLNQEILSLRDLRRKRLVTAGVDGERVRKRQAALDLEFAVNMAFLELLEAQDQLRIFREYRRNVDKSLELTIVRELFEKGQDVVRLKWQQERMRATYDIIRASTRVESARVVLNSLLNQPGHQLIVLDRSEFSEEKIVGRLGLLRRKLRNMSDRREAESFLVRLAFDVNPSLEKNRHQRKLQSLRLSRHRADYMPEVGFRASLDVVDSLAARPSFSEEHVTWSVGATVSLPLYLGGRRKHEGRKLSLELSALEYERDLERVSLMSRVRVKATEFFSWGFLLPASSEASQSASQYYDLVLPEYESGDMSLDDILQTGREARDSQLTFNSSRYRFFGAAAKLSHTIGLSTEITGSIPIDDILGRLNVGNTGN